MQAVGTIYGGLQTRKAMNNVRDNLAAQLQANQDWYDRRYNEDATQMADAQRLLTMTEDSIRNRNRQAAGVQAVTGGTEESVAAAKAANNQALADATSKINAQAQAQKNLIERQYQKQDSAIQAKQNEMEIKKAEETAKVAQDFASAGSQIAGLI